MGSQIPLKGAQPHLGIRFVYCGQMAGWIKTPLSTEVDLGPGHIVLDGDPPPPAKGAQTPISATAELLFKWLSQKITDFSNFWKAGSRRNVTSDLTNLPTTPVKCSHCTLLSETNTVYVAKKTGPSRLTANTLKTP